MVRIDKARKSTRSSGPKNEPPPSMFACLHRLALHWESCQVELHGRYSASQLMALADYEKQSSTLHTLVVLLLTPVPCIVLLVAVELIPLKPAFVGGLHAQGAAYWLRTLYSAFLVAFASIAQVSHCSPQLPLSAVKLTAVSLAMMASTALTFLCLHMIIGFPTPFLYTLEAVVWQAFYIAAIWSLWGDKIRSSVNVQRDFSRYVWFCASQATMLAIYPAMTYMYRILDGQYQTLFSIVLPLIKLAIKNVASYGIYRLEHYAPLCVTFSVDVFHALFSANAMQSSRTIGTFAIAVAVDVFQSLVAIWEVHAVLRRLQAHEITATTAHNATSWPQIQGAVKTNSLQNAMSMLASSPTLREHPQIALARHEGRVRNRGSLQYQPTRVAASPSSGNSSSTTMLRKVDDQSMFAAIDQQQTLPAVSQARLSYVQDTLQLMYMAEFYILIELTEVIVTVVYAIYLGAMFFLPNRFNFAHLKHLTDDQYLETLAYVAKYAAYELVSLLVLGSVFRWMLGISPTHHVALTLEKNWFLAQSLLIVWVFFSVQMSLDHLGNDYSLTFEWLHTSNP